MQDGLLVYRRLRLSTIFLFPVLFMCCNQKTHFVSTCRQINKKYYSLLKDTQDRQKTFQIIEEINAVIRKNRYCNDAYLLLGDIYLSKGEYEQAKKNFFHVLENDSENIYSIFKIGILFQKMGFNDSAVQYFDWAEKIKNTNGFVYDIDNEFEEMTDFNSHDVKYSKIIFNKGIANYFKGDFLNSMYDLNYCIKHEVILDETYFYRGLIYLRIKDSIRACSDFRSAQFYGNSNSLKYLQELKCH